MVTSATPGEGKTSLALQLALSLARAGFPTLLMDADFRCPNLHNLLGLPLGPGLGDVLQGRVEVGDVLRHHQNLAVITTGSCDPRVAIGHIQTGLPRVLENYKQQFQFVVIDAPPVLDLPDAILLGLTADGTILSALRDVSRLPLLQAALDRLSVRNIRVLGAVLNGTPLAAGYRTYGR
jgi:Mrp family chromosome partitioning ATPase